MMPFVIANPETSLLWQIPEVQAAARDLVSLQIVLQLNIIKKKTRLTAFLDHASRTVTGKPKLLPGLALYHAKMRCMCFYMAVHGYRECNEPGRLLEMFHRDSSS